MSGPRSYEAAIVEDHSRRIEKAEENISETKKAVFQIEKAIAQLKTPMEWIQRLAFAAVIGIGGLILTSIAALILKKAP